MLFLKTYVKLVSSENHNNEPKQIPATSIGRKIRSLTIYPVLTHEKTAAKANSLIGFVKARRNVEIRVFVWLFDRLGVACSDG
jgi:hypothetical protein